MLFTASGLFIGEIVSIADFGPETHFTLRFGDNRNGGTVVQTWATRWDGQNFVGVYSGCLFMIAVR